QTAPVLKARLDEERHEQERANLEEQLQQSQKMEAIGTLAGGVAHDFNNILMTILGNSQMVLENLKKEDPIREEIQQIYQAGERATSLTSQLLAFSRKQVIHPQIMGLDTKIQELEKMLQRILGEDIDMSITCETGVSPIKADPGQIDQVIMNLAVNARDAMPLGGQFRIEARNVHLDRSLADTHLDLSAGDYVLLSISDTGSGIPKEIQYKIFEPFFTTKQKGKGTGLGLSTVYGIVKQNGGSITVYSEGSKGATFKLYFPRATQTKVTGKEPSQSARDDSGTETILVIEDEEMVRSYVRRALTKKGYQVLTAGYYREALDAFNQAPTPVDLVLTDVILPHKSGKEISDKLLAMNPSMKIIFMSGYTDDEILRHNILHAQANYIQKPFAPADLLKIVRDVLDGD
ncbi:response regulator, partial [bacterium]|nr:response regulator [bacterium]